MAYYNTSDVTDFHVADIVERETITAQITQLDNEIENICIAKGVSVSEIPVDDDGYITSPTLITYARFWLYHTLLSDYWGGANGENDIYYEKLKYYESQMVSAKQSLTAANILNTDLDEGAFVKFCPVY